MGVTGLWRLIEPAGKPVPVETLENKVLAVDISIWLHQMVKGYQDAKGAPLPNAHLMGLFQRLCKLLYFRIKPVFVFDGAFPELKRETIAKRQDSKAKYHSESERLKRELAILLGKKTAIGSLLGKQISPKKGTAPPDKDDDIFKLPALPEKEIESESESDDEDSSGSVVDLHSVDIESENFKSLPIKDKYNLLLDLKETRKMNSWGKLHELPKKSDNFSDFQMQRLLKRRKVQECLEETEKEMGDAGMSLAELESLLNEEGIDTKIDSLPTRRIASDNTTRILMINNVKQALEDAKKRQEALEKPQQSTIESTENESKSYKKDELQEDIERAIKMSLENANEADISGCTSKTDDSWTSFTTNSDFTDSEDEDGFEAPDLTTAKAYIMQYSDLTRKAINDLVEVKKGKKLRSNITKAEKIIQQLNKEKSVIVDIVNLSSDDEDNNQHFENSHPKRGTFNMNFTGDCIIVDGNNKGKPMKVDNMNLSCNANINLTSNTRDFEKLTCDNISTSENTKEDNMDAIESSVICVGNPTSEIICLDTSTEDDTKQNVLKPTLNTEQTQNTDNSNSSDEDFEEVLDDTESKFKKPEQTQNSDNSDSSDEDFEEVLDDTECKFKKPVVQINLNLGEGPGDDDIFADIFTSIEPKALSVRNTTNIDKSIEYSMATNKNVTKMIEEPNKLENIERLIIKDEVHNEINVPPLVSSNTRPIKHAQPGVKVTSGSIDKLKEIPIPETKPSTDEDDELQKAIQMSLECVQETEATVLNVETIKPNKESQYDKQTEPLASTSKAEISEPVREPLSTEQLNNLAKELQHEEQDLIQEKGKLDRIGRNITEQMTKEAQELLQIFGIPYIIAPMEAEAQCAFLESVNLTDGTITDDSDIWLFGGRTVYKNFFNQKKHVLQFLAERIERSFNLSREQFILLALLVGSDYTTGVTGVGPVTALEILASFPFNKKQFLSEGTKQEKYARVVAGLEEFKKWVKAGKRTDNTTLKKKLKNVDLNDDFPSIRVVQAYLDPNIEKSEEKFTWGELDITVLRDYAKAKFGWSQNKLDEIVKPVLKRLQDRKTQRSVQDYFKRKLVFQPLDEQLSKRVKAAVQKMGPDITSVEGSPTDLPEVTIEKENPKQTRKRKTTKKSTATEIQEGPSESKKQKNEEEILLKNQGVRVVSQIKDGKSSIEINIPKTDRFQEIIPQREKEKQSLLQNKLKAIEIFRKTNIDKKKKYIKKRVNLPKENAELSESSDTD